MDIETLVDLLEHTEIGSRVAGTATGKEYGFGGIREYSARGARYAHLKGGPVAVLVSGERRRSEIVLFVAPLLFFVNATEEEPGYGMIPTSPSRSIAPTLARKAERRNSSSGLTPER